MNGSYWFYSPETHRRVLLLQHSVKPEAKPEEVRKAARGLGAKAASELQARKCEDVEILLSDKLDKDLHGIFANSFQLSNYEYSHKTPAPVDKEADDKARAEADYDERTKKHGKVIPKVSIKTST